jgi:hypothetical protein
MVGNPFSVFAEFEFVPQLRTQNSAHHVFYSWSLSIDFSEPDHYHFHAMGKVSNTWEFPPHWLYKSSYTIPEEAAWVASGLTISE